MAKLAMLLGLLSAAFAATGAAQQPNPYAARLPAELRAAGKLLIGTSPTYPPLEYKDPATNTLLGLDVDLGNEIARRLGLQPAWVEQGFEQLITSLDTGRIDMGASGMTDIPTRREKTDFVDYFATGVQLFSMPQAAAGLNKPEDVCGKPVAVNRNGIFYIRMREFSEQRCVAKGLPAVNFSLTDRTADARLQILQGRVVAAAQGVDAIRYLNESASSADRGKFVLIGGPISTDLAGFGIAKSRPALRDVVADVVTAMIADGTYARIFQKWELPYTMVREVTINGAPRAP
jgi:polar amino acid transport system substrate-binding protein